MEYFKQHRASVCANGSSGVECALGLTILVTSMFSTPTFARMGGSGNNLDDRPRITGINFGDQKRVSVRWAPTSKI